MCQVFRYQTNLTPIHLTIKHFSPSYQKFVGLLVRIVIFCLMASVVVMGNGIGRFQKKGQQTFTKLLPNFKQSWITNPIMQFGRVGF